MITHDDGDESDFVMLRYIDSEKVSTALVTYTLDRASRRIDAVVDGHDLNARFASFRYCIVTVSLYDQRRPTSCVHI